MLIVPPGVGGPPGRIDPKIGEHNARIEVQVRFFDKTLLWDERNIPKGELWVKGDLSQLAIQTLWVVPVEEGSRFRVEKSSNREARVNGPIRRVFWGMADPIGRYV
jgi:hypothetical protein